MNILHTTLSNLVLVKPDPALHAAITLSWFTSDSGKETLLLMGNAENEIKQPTLSGEFEILKEFVELETIGEQITWMIEFEKRIIGVAWIELTENHRVLPPSIHLMIGDKEYRGRGIGKAVMFALIQYIKQNISSHTIYSRHLTSNVVVASMNQSIGFKKDNSPYSDDNGLEWQNVKMLI